MYLKLLETAHAFIYYSIISDCDWQKSEQLCSNSCFNKVSWSFWNLSIKESIITHTFLDQVMLFVLVCKQEEKRYFLDPFPIKDLLHFLKFLSSADIAE